MPWYMGHLPGVNEIYAGIIRPSAESSTAENPSAGVWDSMGGGGDEHGHDHAHHTTAPTASPSASPSGSPTPDPCDGVPPCSMVCNTRYRECLAAPADCTELYAAHPTPAARWIYHSCDTLERGAGNGTGMSTTRYAGPCGELW